MIITIYVRTSSPIFTFSTFIFFYGKGNAKMTGDRTKMLMLTLPFMVRDLIAPEVIVHCSIYIDISCLLKHILVYTRLNSTTQQSTGPGLDPVCTACLTWLIPAMRLWRCSFSAWTGTFQLASPLFLCLSFQNCTQRLLSCWTFSSGTCPTRQAKKPSGISKRHTAFYTRSARLCYGGIRTIVRAKPQRYLYILVCTCLYLYILVHTDKI